MLGSETKKKDKRYERILTSWQIENARRCKGRRGVENRDHHQSEAHILC